MRRQGWGDSHQLNRNGFNQGRMCVRSYLSTTKYSVANGITPTPINRKGTQTAAENSQDDNNNVHDGVACAARQFHCSHILCWFKLSPSLAFKLSRLCKSLSKSSHWNVSFVVPC